MKTEIFHIISTKVGTRIKTLREARHLSQQDLADLCNFDKGDMSKIESGKANPTLKTFMKISQALEVSLADIFQIENIELNRN